MAMDRGCYNAAINEKAHTQIKLFVWWHFNPYKIGPSGEPIKNRLLGRFPTLRKDDADVESSCPPPLPPPGPVGYVKVGSIF
jgi:hypothetical protein